MTLNIIKEKLHKDYSYKPYAITPKLDNFHVVDNKIFDYHSLIDSDYTNDFISIIEELYLNYIPFFIVCHLYTDDKSTIQKVETIYFNGYLTEIKLFDSIGDELSYKNFCTSNMVDKRKDEVKIFNLLQLT